MRGDARTAKRARTGTARAIRAVAVAAWLAVGVAALTADLVHPRLRPEDGAAHTVVTGALWLAYGGVVAALLLPGPRALTVVRIAVPAAAVQLALAAAAAAADGLDVMAVAGTAAAALGGGSVLQPAYAEAQVDAASYGDERRFLLRPPAPVLVALILPTWAVSAVGVAAGPLLLTARGWGAGLLGAAVGLSAAAFAAHTLFRLARRWLVFVPNGVVVHDHLAVVEPLSLGRRDIGSIGPALADTAAADLTAQAFGMALELRFKEPATAGVMTGRNRSEQRSLTAILVSPSRPAAVLATAERRGIQLA